MNQNILREKSSRRLVGKWSQSTRTQIWSQLIKKYKLKWNIWSSCKSNWVTQDEISSASFRNFGFGCIWYVRKCFPWKVLEINFYQLSVFGWIYRYGNRTRLRIWETDSVLVKSETVSNCWFKQVIFWKEASEKK